MAVENATKTIERENIIRSAGYKLETIWECQWNEIKGKIKNKKEIEH